MTPQSICAYCGAISRGCLDDARGCLDDARGCLDDAPVRDAVSHRLEVAIDAVARVGPDLLEAEAPDEWPKIVGMRNVPAHQYSDLDQEILQNTIDNRLEGFGDLVERRPLQPVPGQRVADRRSIGPQQPSASASSASLSRMPAAEMSAMSFAVHRFHRDAVLLRTLDRRPRLP